MKLSTGQDSMGFRMMKMIIFIYRSKEIKSVFVKLCFNEEKNMRFVKDLIDIVFKYRIHIYKIIKSELFKFR